MDSWKDHTSAKLTLKSENGELSMTVEVNFGQYNPNDGKFGASRGYQGLQGRQVGPSQLRRRQRRSDDQGVQKRAAEHAAGAAPAARPAAADETPAQQLAAEKAAAGKAAAAEKAAAQQANRLFTRLESRLVPEGFLTAQFLQNL